MDRARVMSRLLGCLLAMPAIYHDDLSLNVKAMRRHIEFVMDHGLGIGNAMLLINGASGEFAMLTTDERMATVDAAVAQADGKIAIIVGAQTLSTREAVQIAQHAQSVGADALQVSPPFYYRTTDDDMVEHLAAIAEAAPDVGIIYYDTYWMNYSASFETLERFCSIEQLVGVKWASPGMKQYQSGILRFRDRLNMIDNQVAPVMNRMLGGAGTNLHPANFWPEWGAKIWQQLEDGQWDDAQNEVNRLLLPYYDIIADIAKTTGGEGHLDKMALELIGLSGGRNRPPTQPLPPQFKERMRELLVEVGAPMDRIVAAGR